MTRTRRSAPSDERQLRAALVRTLSGGRAHAELAATLRAFPRVLRGRKPRGAPHTPWELLEHMRLAQEDILRFSLDPAYESPPWPEGFWPASAAPRDASAWERSVRAFLRDLRALTAIATERDLLAPIPETTTSFLGQLLLAASHNSYHLGQLVQVRRTLEGRGKS